jgi:hypothetical protein
VDGLLDGLGVKIDGVKSSADGVKNSVDVLLDGLGDKIDSAVKDLLKIFKTKYPKSKIKKGLFNKSSADLLLKTNEEFIQTFSDIKSEFSNLINPLSVSSGTLPIFFIGNVKGVNISIDLSKYSSELSIIGLAVLFLASLISIRIILE